MITKPWRFIWYWGMLGLLGLGCVHEPVAPGDPSNRITIVLDQAPRSLDPRFTIDSTSTRVSRLTFSALVNVDNDALQPQPDLAERITQDKDDPTLWHVHVRKGVTFHSGEPLTGKDVAYTYSSILDPKLGSPYRGDFLSKFRSIEVDPDNEYHVLFYVKRPYATFRTDLVLGIVPKSLRDAPDQKFPEGVVTGSGPYRFYDEVPERLLSLKRFEEWHGDVPATKWIVFRVIRDENTRILSLLGGSSDLSINGVSPILRDVMEEREDIQVSTRPGIGFTYLGLNLRHPILSKNAVRKALSLGIDREAIIRDRFLGGARKASGMLPEFHWAFEPTPEASRFDLIEAERLLDEAGYKRASDTGIRMTLEFKISSNRFRLAIARMLARQWKQIGIEIKLRAFEFSTFFADVRKGNFDIFLLQLPEPIEPDMYRWMLYSMSTPTKEPDSTGRPMAQLDRRFFVPGFAALEDDSGCHDWMENAWKEGSMRWAKWMIGIHSSTGTGNRTYYSNPRFDCLVERGQWETDLSKRKDLYRDIQLILANDLPILPLWHEDQVVYHHKSIKGFSLLPTSQLTPILNAHIEAETD